MNGHVSRRLGIRFEPGEGPSNLTIIGSDGERFATHQELKERTKRHGNAPKRHRNAPSVSRPSCVSWASNPNEIHTNHRERRRHVPARFLDTLCSLQADCGRSALPLFLAGISL